MPPLDHLLSPPAQQALIAGLFVAVGWWVVSFQSRRRDRQMRAERVRDVQRALFAEVRANIAALIREDLDSYGDEIATRIETEEGFFPTIPTEANDAVFRAIIGDIHVLPRDTIDPVVLYYTQLNRISAAISDLRAIDVAQIGAERAAALYLDYIALRIEALELGQQVMAAIVANQDGQNPAPPKNPKINNPDANPSGRESV
ncbi:MAG: hypothetical protein Q4F71_06160 [Paracoccus sp. (in: a-proteobacteria)]|nr:hypothetical protein [Paracoccus sp. (in: a-proteobacteria)]